MNRDEIVAMARKVGLERIVYTMPCGASDWIVPEYDRLERFAALVAAAEREACAKVCADVYHQHIGPQYGEVRYGVASSDAAIRARSNNEN